MKYFPETKKENLIQNEIKNILFRIKAKQKKTSNCIINTTNIRKIRKQIYVYAMVLFSSYLPKAFFFIIY